MKEQIFPKNGPKPVGPYSPAIKANGFIFVSGQGPVVMETGEHLVGTIEEKVHRVMGNLQVVLEAAGSSLDKVVKTTIYVTDLGNFKKVNEAYGQYLLMFLRPVQLSRPLHFLPGSKWKSTLSRLNNSRGQVRGDRNFLNPV